MDGVKTNKNNMMDKKKKTAWFSVFRHGVQAAAFLLFPGLFISVFSALKDIFAALIGGTFSFAALSQQLILAGGVLLFTAAMGRFFCGYLCAFGSMGDLMWFAGRKLKLPVLKISEKTDRMLKWVKYGLLVGVVALIWTGVAAVNPLWNPWTIFGMYASLGGWPAGAYFLSIGGLLLFVIMVGSLFVRRFFCRYLCPLGAVFAAVSRFCLFRIKKPTAGCKSCRFCTSQCIMGIPLYQSDVIDSGECIDCFNCVQACPRHNVTANPAPAVATAVTIGALTGFYFAGNLTAHAVSAAQVSNTDTAAASEQVSATGQYTDGVYTGSADGYHGTTQVSVTVEGGAITDIEVLSYADNEEFFDKAKNTVIAEIIQAQDTDVATVSGATFSSRGLIAAVADALSGAGGDAQTEEADVSAAESQTQSEDASQTAAQSAALDLVDGVYTGSGTGLRGTTTVSVTVSGGVITEISVQSYQDDAQYFSRAKDTMIAEIIDAQSVDVATVSGATFSSNGILEAVADALELDFTNPNNTAEGDKHR